MAEFEFADKDASQKSTVQYRQNSAVRGKLALELNYGKVMASAEMSSLSRFAGAKVKTMSARDAKRRSLKARRLSSVDSSAPCRFVGTMSIRSLVLHKFETTISSPQGLAARMSTCVDRSLGVGNAFIPYWSGIGGISMHGFCRGRQYRHR